MYDNFVDVPVFGMNETVRGGQRERNLESYTSHSPAPQLSVSVVVVAFCLLNNKLPRRYIELSL